MNSIRKRGLEKLSALLDIELNYSHAKHNFELGLPLEGSLRHFFKSYFPSRYGFSTGYIVDDHDNVSNQTDWIVYNADTFSPLLARLHGEEGAEWFPFDSVYGVVEVKRTLTEKALYEAIKQIARTKQLKRSETSLLQVSPYIRIPEKMLRIAEGAQFNEICNSLYTGLYAFLPGDYEDPNVLYQALEQISKEVGERNLPDFFAVHGRYYVRRAIHDDKTGKLSISSFLEQANSFITIESSALTAGVFYTDLMFQFSNMNLSAMIYQTGFGDFLRSQDILKVTGKRIYA